MAQTSQSRAAVSAGDDICASHMKPGSAAAASGHAGDGRLRRKPRVELRSAWIASSSRLVLRGG